MGQYENIGARMEQEERAARYAEWKVERAEIIRTLREEGLNWHEIGRRSGVTGGRARTIYKETVQRTEEN